MESFSMAEAFFLRTHRHLYIKKLRNVLLAGERNSAERVNSNV